MNSDYPKLIAERSVDLKLVLGKTLEQILVNVVSYEFNVLYLKFDQIWFAIHGELGGEFIGIRKLEPNDTPVVQVNESSGIFTYQPYDLFVGKKLVNVRHIGEAWNGHGFEFSFASLPAQTLIVQSIYTGTEPEDFFDCIRLGIGQYYCDATRFKKSL